ncbi:MAG: hypothetical protein H5T61_03080 [Thermoflexales bacterium]|nr:hypothetical protein [Thermoflexales bacterium]
MPSYHLTLPYRSAWYTVLLPTLICLGVWAGLALGVPALRGWNIPGWLGALLCLGGFVPGLAAAWATYGLLLRLAERGRGEVVLEGDRLRWRTGRRWHEVDFTRPYWAGIAAGFSGLGERNACISLNPGGQEIHLKGARREEVLRLFPEPGFVDELAALPEEGGWGFVLSADDPTAVRFFNALVECLWRNRQNNERFRLYQKFPWHRRPQPAFRHIRCIRPEERTPEDEALLADLQAQFLDGLADSPVRVTPDYLVGWAYRSPRGLIGGWPDSYVMPLGFITADVSLPQPTLEEPAEKRLLYVQGVGEDGNPLKLAFDWYGAMDKEHEEAEFVVRFVRAMWGKAR